MNRKLKFKKTLWIQFGTRLAIYFIISSLRKMFNNQLDTHEHQPCRVAITLRMRRTLWPNSAMHGCAHAYGDGQTVEIV